MGKYVFLSVVSVFIFTACSPQNRDPQQRVPINSKGDLLGDPAVQGNNWFTKDPSLDGFEGTSADRAYAELGLKVGVKPVIVAVIDSGVDVEHEDLKAQIWNNPGETGSDESGSDKATNGVDDDKNGYIDDVHGWNFLGSYDKDHKPVNLVHTTLEMTRELVKMKALKAKREAAGQSLTSDEAAYLAKLDSDVSSERSSAKSVLDTYTKYKAQLKAQYDILKNVLTMEFDKVTLGDVQAIESTDSVITAAQSAMINLFNSRGVNDIARVNRVIDRYFNTLEYYLNEGVDPRSVVIKDDPSDFTDHNYGNNDVKGSDGEHGSHVSGMIAAVRHNGIGINGVATDVRIMSLRAVPDGDEADKDIYNAVKYAADNGAQIINMSFGKAYSPYKNKVDEAFQYAAAKGVLIVHAAGNASANLDTAANFPNRKALKGGEIPGWLEVGASSATKGVQLNAVFSNYGKNSVDLFAPGVNIESTIPELNQYAVFSGTSMASPAVAGVAALILSQHQDMKAVDLRELVLSTVRPYTGLEVWQPSDGSAEPLLVQFDSLSITGGIVDVLAALKKAVGFN